VLMGAIAGLMEAQYNTLRQNGHSPSEAFNETVEEATQSLYPLIGKNGMDWMYKNCSTTAQRGALDWRHEFRKAAQPVFDRLYESVRIGNETRIVLQANTAPDYSERLGRELSEMAESEMWRAGTAVRGLRPENMAKSGGPARGAGSSSGAAKPRAAKPQAAKPSTGGKKSRPAPRKAAKKSAPKASRKPSKKKRR
jgi:ketol-acid reductoisomerase